jgi:hypothetical protein
LARIAATASSVILPKVTCGFSVVILCSPP